MFRPSKKYPSRDTVPINIGDGRCVRLWQDVILEESLQHGDIIQEGFLDSYANLTVKSLMLLKWFSQASHSCSSSGFLRQVTHSPQVVFSGKSLMLFKWFSQASHSCSSSGSLRQSKIFLYFFGGLECVGHSFADVAHFVF